MPELVRLKSYKTFMEDGRSSTTMGIKDKKKVFVGLLLGVEPAEIKDKEDYCDTDAVILALAKHIRKVKKEAKELEKKVAVKLKKKPAPKKS